MNKIIISWLTLLTIMVNYSMAQDTVYGVDSLPKLVQFSGVVVSGDSLIPVPFTNIYDKATGRGTMADYYGYFSLVAKEGDTIIFSSVGYKKSEFDIPKYLLKQMYSLIHMMESDTIVLKQIKVFPWPSKEQFADAFVNLKIPDDDLQRAYQNLTPQAMAQLSKNITMDGSQNYNWVMSQRQTAIYYTGQVQPMNFMSPIAWAKFLQAWRNGEFKKQ